MLLIGFHPKKFKVERKLGMVPLIAGKEDRNIKTIVWVFLILVCA